jgi:hypothetical protein
MYFNNQNNMCKIKQPKEKAKEIIRKIFDLQHVDDRAKMISLSTSKIAELFCDEMIEELLRESADDSCSIEYWEEVKIEVQSF